VDPTVAASLRRIESNVPSTDTPSTPCKDAPCTLLETVVPTKDVTTASVTTALYETGARSHLVRGDGGGADSSPPLETASEKRLTVKVELE